MKNKSGILEVVLIPLLTIVGQLFLCCLSGALIYVAVNLINHPLEYKICVGLSIVSATICGIFRLLNGKS